VTSRAVPRALPYGLGESTTEVTGCAVTPTTTRDDLLLSAVRIMTRFYGRDVWLDRSHVTFNIAYAHIPWIHRTVIIITMITMITVITQRFACGRGHGEQDDIRSEYKIYVRGRGGDAPVFTDFASRVRVMCIPVGCVLFFRCCLSIFFIVARRLFL